MVVSWNEQMNIDIALKIVNAAILVYCENRVYCQVIPCIMGLEQRVRYASLQEVLDQWYKINCLNGFIMEN